MSKQLKIQDIDKNFKTPDNITEPDIVWYNVKQSPFSIHGVTFDDSLGLYVRMPDEIAKTVSPSVEVLNKHTSGGRVRFKTNSTYIAINISYKADDNMMHMSALGQRGFDLYKTIDGISVYSCSFVPPLDSSNGYTSSFTLDGDLLDYTINFPTYHHVCELRIAIKKDAILEAPTPYLNFKPIVYYGSSITQGGCASRAGCTYQHIISRQTNLDFINLGFSGSCKAEDNMINYLATLDCSIFVLDYDYNAESLEHLIATHEKALRTLRKAHPNMPIIMISAPDIYLKKDELYYRRKTIYENYQRLKNEGDENVYYIDGTTFYGNHLSECTVDGTHPNDAGFVCMADKLLPLIKNILKI